MKLITLLALFILTMPTFANDALITLESKHSAEETANKFVQLVKEKELQLFARINHAANAAKVDLTLKPTEVILFGSPAVGTVLMQCSETVAIDLPQRVLIWQNLDEKVYLSYTNPAYMREVHAIDGCDLILEKITSLLATLSARATE